MKRILLYIFLFVISLEMKAQDPIIMTIGNAEGYQGDEVCVDVVLDNMDHIGVFEFSISYDTTLVTIRDENITINEGIFDPDLMAVATGLANTKEMTFIGFMNQPDIAESISIPNEPMFTLCFTLDGPPGSMIPLDFSYSMNSISFTRILNDISTSLDYETNSGKLTILPDDNDIGITTSVCDETFSVMDNGSISFMAVAGKTTQAPYSWTITGPSGTFNGDGLMGEVSGLSNGDYMITVTDSNGKSSTKTVTIITSPEIIPEVLPIDPVCAGSKGSLEIIAVDPDIDSYKIKWESQENDLVKYGQVKLSSAPEGTYLLTLTNANGCEYVSEHIIQGPQEIELENIVIDRPCFDGDATITADIIGGNEPEPGFTYNVSLTYNDTGLGETILTNNINETIEDQISGTPVKVDSIFLEIRDAKNCRTIPAIKILIPRPDSIAVDTMTTITCEGNQASVVVTGGTQPYTYSWSHDASQTGSIGTGMGQGFTDCVITDANNCQKVVTFFFPNDINGNVDFTVVGSTVSCFGQEDGTAEIQVATESEWNVTWYRDAMFTDEITEYSGQFTVNTLPAGEYFVKGVNSTLGCDLDKSVIISTPTEIQVNIVSTTPESCAGESDGAVTLSATGGNPTGSTLYTFSIDGKPTMAGQQVTFSSMMAGTYNVNIIDENNCTKTTEFTIEAANPFSISLDESRTKLKSCNREFGTFAVNTDGGVQPITYRWNRDGVIYKTTTIDIVDSLGTGAYTVTAVDANGCFFQLDTTITLMDVEQIAFELSADEPQCYGERACLYVDNITGGSGSGYQVQVDFGVATTFEDCVNVFAGSHSVIVIDSDGCPSEVMTIDIDQPEQIVLDAGDDIKLKLGEESDIISLDIQAQNAIDSILWSPNKDINYKTLDGQVVTVSPYDDVLYTITVIDSEGCQSTDELFVDVNKSRRIPVANIFSPNGDSKNDYFSLSLPASVRQINSFAVYDRFGNIIFEESDIIPVNGTYQGWDGKVNGNYVMPGVYVWLASFEYIDGQNAIRNGSVTVVR